jgi:selenocysteine lyase/cysteine desulfurase
MIDKIEPPFVDLLSATWTENQGFEYAAGAKRFENWESYVAGRVGLMAAVRYANDIGLHNIERRVEQLGARLRDQLQGVPGVTVHDLGVRKCGIVTFTKDGTEPQALSERLRERGMNISVSALAYARLDLGQRNIPALARASVHYFNTDTEIDRFTEAVKSV